MDVDGSAAVHRRCSCNNQEEHYHTDRHIVAEHIAEAVVVNRDFAKAC